MVCFVDAAHFVHGPFLGYLWCFVRLLMRAASGRKRYNVLGAIDAVTHELTRVQLRLHQRRDGVRAAPHAGGTARGPAVDAGPGQRPLPEVRGGAVPGRRVGDRVVVPAGYSPNLNLIERLWKFVKKESLNSTYYEVFEQFTTAIDACCLQYTRVRWNSTDPRVPDVGDVPYLAASSISPTFP